MSQPQQQPQPQQNTTDLSQINELLLLSDGFTSSTLANDIDIITPKQSNLTNVNVISSTTNQIPGELQSSLVDKNFPVKKSSTSSDSGSVAHDSLPGFLIKHSDQIVVDEVTKENHRVARRDITPAQLGVAVEDNNSTGETIGGNWRFADSDRQQSGGCEENSRPGESTTITTSLDRVIIGSLQQQQQQQQQRSSVEVTPAVPRQSNQTKLPSSSSNGSCTIPGAGAAAAANLIQISDKAFHSTPEQSIARLAHKSTSQHSATTAAAASFNNPADSKRLRFKSFLDTTAAAGSSTPVTITSTTTTCDSSSGELNNSNGAIVENTRQLLASDRILPADAHRKQEEILLDTLHEDAREEEEEQEDNCRSDDYDEDDDDNQQSSEYNNNHRIGKFERYSKLNGRGASFRKSTSRLLGGHTLIRIQRLLGALNSKLIDTTYEETPYVHYESKDLLTGDSKYPSSPSPSSSPDGRGRKKHPISGKTFRGSYKYSRAEVSMAIFKKLINLLFQRSTLALIGAFLIHITLGTVYTLSNINSYLTSYMRLHGSPTLTYGGSMWISSFYAVGQGFSMVLGGYLEKRFSARLACFLGCLIHSGSIMGTSWTVNHGSLAVLMSYGFLPGFGCGLAYMTPMSNGFGWFPNRRGLVAGVILAGFGIGTFVFNIAQTAYVNPDNLSPPENASGYFTQESILTKVPGLFLFIGSIYAAMQFVGCCLLFKPPSSSGYSSPGKSPDERPILETEMSVSRAVRTREFAVLFLVYGIITQGVLFVNSMIKEYGQLFIGDDMYLAWTGSMASIANALGRLVWGLAIDRYTFTQCFTCITTIFGLLMFVMPFEFVLSSKHLYLLCTLGIFGSFSGWMSTFPVHLSRTFGRLNSGMLYGLIFISQVSGALAFFRAVRSTRIESNRISSNILANQN